MSYLEQYDAIPDDRPRDRVGLVSRWLRSDWRPFFQELREHRPILVTPAFTLVTRFPDVQEILSRPRDFSVRIYQGKMDPVVAGPFMLARDETPVNWREKGIMQAMLQPEDLPCVRMLCGRLADEALAAAAAEGRIEVVSRLGRYVPTRLCGEYFGFPGPDLDTMYRWSRATQADMFKNLANDPDVHAASVQAGQEMMEYLRGLLAEKRSAQNDLPDDGPQSPRPAQPLSFLERLNACLRLMLHGELPTAEPSASSPPAGAPSTSGPPAGGGHSSATIFDRLVATRFDDAIHFDDHRLISNIAGLLIGAVETTSQAIVQVIEQILQRPDIASAARDAIAEGDEAFDRYVWEALRFNPINPLVFRFCESDYTVAAGTERAHRVAKGTTVFACTASAQFDAAELTTPDEFVVDRPAYHTMHFGYGHHKCLGADVAAVMIPEVVKRVLLLPGIRLLDGDAGKIDFQGGPFPEQFTVAFDAAD